MPHIRGNGYTVYFHDGLDECAALDILLYERPDNTSMDGKISRWFNAEMEPVCTLIGVTYDEFMAVNSHYKDDELM